MGLDAFASFPVLRLAGILEWGGGGLWVLLLSTYGACVFVLGIAVARTGTKRSLSPQLALWAPILVAVLAVAMDLLTRGRLIEWWEIHFQWSRPNISNLAYAFGHQLVWIGVSTVLVIGAAIGGRRWQWWFVGVGLLAIPVVILFGTIPAIIGYRAASLPDE